jgi:hypothetical protein
MSLFGISSGDHVITTSSVSTGLFSSVPRGTRGIVRDTTGLFSTQYVVEFNTGWGTTVARGVPAGKLRATGLHGESAWALRRNVRSGVRLGMWALAAPAVVGAVVYIARGGDPALLAGAVIGDVASTVMQFALPVVPALVLVAVLWHVIRGGRGAR